MGRASTSSDISESQLFGGEMTTNHQARNLMTNRSLSRRLFAGLSILLLCVVAGCGSSTPQPMSSSSANTASVRIDTAYVSQVKARVLVNGSGYSLYMFVPDHQRSVTCDVTCAGSWPPVTVSPGTRPQVGKGIEKNLVSTIAFTPGYRVVTYNRWPLYTYQADVSPGMATGQGTDLNGGFWYLMSPNGAPLVPAGDPNP